MHPDYVNELLGVLGRLLAGKDPKWDFIVDDFGTHYAHAVTCGTLEFAETQFSLDVETDAYTRTIDIAENASAAAMIRASRGIASPTSPSG